MYEYISTIIVTFVFFFGIFIYFAVIISGSKHEKEAHDFFDDEDGAEKKFIDTKNLNLNFIKPSYENIIILDDKYYSQEKEVLRAFKKQESIKELISLPMIILSESSSTEIKIKYGANNFNMITEYEQNYYTFVNQLYEFALLLYRCNLKEHSIKILEEAIILKSENINVFDLLGKIYRELNMFDDLNGLFEYVNYDLKNDVLKNTLNAYM